MGRNPGIVQDCSGISRALDIDGWMDEFELDWLAQEARTHHLIVEVGSYKGRSTRALADNCPGVVYAFDDWHGPREALFIGGERIETDFSSLFEEFRHNCEDLIDKDKVRLIIGDHSQTSVIPIDFLQGSDDERPDMVFIDGGHDYDEVKRDIMIWQSRLRPGGLLCGHDASWDGVFRAVNEIGLPWEIGTFTDIWRVLG